MDLDVKEATVPKPKRERDDESVSCHEFNFPYPPYNIQLDLMKEAYQTFEDSKFAILESPTGTGKSLSLICSSLTWLRNHQKKIKEDIVTKKEILERKIEDLKKEEEASGDWLTVQTKCQELIKQLADLNKELDRINDFDTRSEARRHARLHNVPLETYSALLNKNSTDAKLKANKDIKNELDNLISSQASNQSEVNEAEPEELEKKIAEQSVDHLKPKIYYSSRTHSQMSQFINEIKKTKFADSTEGPPIKVTPLASRANLCVNSEVLKLREPTAINERCMEMQKETSKEKRCPYIKAKQVNMLKDDILTSVQDIEDIVSRGRAIGSCPYYASRMAIPEAEMVVLPYNNLLHRETREASSMDLKGNIIIVDEAHNILETICSIHSAQVNGLQLVGSHTIISRYYRKYHSRMSPRNALIVKTIVQCLTALIRYLNNPKKQLKDYDCPILVNLDNEEYSRELKDGGDQDSDNKGKSPVRHEELLIDINKFIGASGVERFNVFKILDYLKRSQLARKLIGFFRQDTTLDTSLETFGISVDLNDQSDSKECKSPKKKKQKKSDDAKSEIKKPLARRWELTSLEFLKNSNPMLKKPDLGLQSYPIYTLIEFLRSLTTSTNDGKVLTDYIENDILHSSLKFILLNPSSQFKQMAEEARSIVLAGGTMQPFEEFIDLLYGPLKISRQRLTLFSCGHVINRDNLFVSSLNHGPTGKPLELSYKTRSCFDTIDEIGRTVMNISMVVPGGMVCFMPSYDYEQICFTRWTKMGLISQIEVKSKHVFREPRQASQLKPIWDEYCRMIVKGRDTGRGSLLFCIVGGKMSEGINFSDDLGRCIVMVGLPFANIKSGELQQKMAYYDKTCKVANSDQRSAGQQYYENLCIKGINQSIGRAIRHKNDYAAIILLDRRYTGRKTVKDGLPGWIKQSLKEHDRFGPMFSEIKSFFSRITDQRS